MEDLINLCRINLLEEKVVINDNMDDSERDATISAIRKKKRLLMRSIKDTQPQIDSGLVESHIKDNTAEDGIYPWTNSPLWR